MIHLNKVYIKKSNPNVKVKPFKFKDGTVHYSSVGFLNWCELSEDKFLDRFELETTDEITYEDFMKAVHTKMDAELIISRYNLQESKKLIKQYGKTD